MKLFKNSFYNIIYTILNILFPLVTSIIVSRVLTSTGIGKVSYAQTIASYFSSIATLGIPIYGIRLISQSKSNKDEFNKTFSELLFINAILNGVVTIAYFCLILFTPFFNENKLIYLAAGIHVLFGIINVDWFYKGTEEYKYIAIRSFIVKALSLISVMIFVNDIHDCEIYTLISSLALGLNNLINIFHSRKLAKISFKNLEFKKHIKPIVYLSIVAFLGLIYNKIDITMLKLIKDETAVGLYTNAHQCINLIVSCITSITAVFLPQLSGLAKTNESEKMIELLNLGSNILLFLGIPAFIGLALTAPRIVVLLFGNSFADGGITLSIFSALCIIYSIGDLLAYQTLMAIGMEKRRILVNLIGCIINIGLNLIFIPLYSQNGAALASVISEFIINLILIIVVAKNIKFKFNIEVILKSILGSIVMGVAVYFLLKINIPNVFSIIISVGFGLIIYILINLLIKNPVLEILKKKIFKTN